MRSLSFALSLLIGCSDYEINSISAEEPAAASDSDVTGEGPETDEEDVDTDEEPTDTATTDEPSSCWGYEIEVTGSDYLEPGWWCLPARPYFNLIGAETIEATPEIESMAWTIELSASPEADIEMDVALLDFDFTYGDVDLVHVIQGEQERWSAVTDDGTELAIGAPMNADHWMAVVIMEEDAGWDPALVIPADTSRQITVTLDTRGMGLSVGDSITASFDAQSQVWEAGSLIPRISTTHVEFPIIGTTYEVTE